MKAITLNGTALELTNKLLNCKKFSQSVYSIKFINHMIENGYKTFITYNDGKINCYDLNINELREIIDLKQSIYDKVNFDGRKFAFAEDCTKEEFEFVRLCDSMKISRKSTVLFF